ncbi:hypothetical protein FACS1894125_6180 [Actinomycetota bacterium]|nr:hypothetical protein FACS1894125_6180 [Actinomycetota bacterium]
MKKLYQKVSKRFTYNSIEKNLMIRILSLIVLTTLAFILIFGVNLVWQQTSTKSLQEQSSQELSKTLTEQIQKSNALTTQTLSQALEKKIDFDFYSIEIGLKYVSDFVSTHYNDPNYKKAISDYLNLLDTDDNTKKHFVLFDDGDQITTSVQTDPALNIDYRKRDWYKKTVQANAFSISNYYISSDINHERIITFSYPINVNGEFVGVTLVDVTLENMGKMILDTDSKAIEDAVLISNDGHYIYSTQNSEEIHTLIEENWMKVKELQELSKTNGSDDGMSSSADAVLGQEHVSIVSPSKANWSVLLLFDFKDLNEGLEQIAPTVDQSRNRVLTNNATLSFIAAVVFLVAAGIIFSIAYTSARRSAKRITDPVVEIVKRIDLIASGDLHQDFSDISTGDELERIAKSTEEMMKALHNHIEQIKLFHTFNTILKALFIKSFSHTVCIKY